MQRLLRRLAGFVVLATLGGSARDSARASIAADPRPAGLVVRGTCDETSDLAPFTIAHLNDLQAHYGDLFGGRSRYGFIAGYLRSIKQEEPSTLVLDAGDDYEKGSIAELRSLGEATRQMVQALPIDVRTIGNHDFAYGEGEVLRDVAMSAHPVLAANVHDADGRSPFLPFVMVQVGCVRVGVVGLVTGHYGSDDQQNDDAFDGVFVHDDHYGRVLREQVALHRSEVDVMVALTHLGLTTDLELASEVPEVDVFVGGHSEDLLRDGWPYIKHDGRGMGWVFQTGHNGEHVGRADFVYDRKTRALHLKHYAMTDVDATLPYAEDVGAKARAVERAFAPDAHAPIAIVRDSIDPPDMPELLARAVRDRWAVDALFVGRDVFWAGLGRGPLTLQRLFDSVPVQREPSGTSGFTSLHIVSMKGDALLELKERAFSGYALELPDSIDPSRTYRVALDKRALEHPSMASGVTFPPGVFAGEIIDVLEAYARARTARGLTL